MPGHLGLPVRGTAEQGRPGRWQPAGWDPAATLDGVPASSTPPPFGVYVHVPFCTVRCGYCDFNTYTASELDGSTQEQYARALLNEVRFATDVLPHIPPLSTVFFGGGTPTLLPPDTQRLLLMALVESFGLAEGAEVTTEANPESVNEESLGQLREAGFNRISFGMQSAAPHVLATLDRQHTPGRVREVVNAARHAGFDSISLDLIY